MAKPTDTSSTASSRTPPTRKRRSRPPVKPEVAEAAAASEVERWEALVEEERGRLMKAHSILTCVIVAMEAEDIPANEGPYWPAVIESACELLDQSIRRLDRVEEPRGVYTLH